MKPVFADLNTLYNVETAEFRRVFRKAFNIGMLSSITYSIFKEQLVYDFARCFPFLADLSLNFDANESIYKEKQLFINTDGGISSPFESILHEIGHCLYFLRRNKLERVRIREFGLSDMPTAPELRLNKFKNELMAGAYQMKMMIMADISIDTITSWLESFANSFTFYNPSFIEKISEGYPVEQFKLDVVAVCDTLTTDHVMKSLKVLQTCFESDILILTKEKT